MKKILIFILFALGVSEAYPEIKVDIDAATFKQGDSSRWEMYYRMPDNSPAYIEEGREYVAKVYFAVVISSNVEPVSQMKWIIRHPLAEAPTKYKNDLVGQKNFILPPGQYKVDIYVIDVNDTSSRAEKTIDLFIPEFPDGDYSMSGIQITRKIERYESGSALDESFVKSGLYLPPNPRVEIIDTMPVLPVYLELYNCDAVNSGEMAIRYEVFDKINKRVLDYVKEKNISQPAVVEITNLPLDTLRSGMYFLRAALYPANENSEDTVYRIKKFYLINPSLPPDPTLYFSENLSFEKSEFITLTEEEADLLIKQSLIIASPNETNVMEELPSLKAKQRALYSFWKRRDPDSTSSYNEFLVEYRERIEFANNHFSYGRSRNGWFTDRGIVYLKFGKPTQRDIQTVKGDLRPYEIWLYDDVQGGIEFDFVDISGFGNFELVNSTAYGQISNPNWYSQFVESAYTDPRYYESEKR